MEEKTILERVKILLEIQDNSADSKIKEYIDLFCNKVKNICKRKDFPHELDYLVVDFARKNYLYYKDKDNSSNEQL